LIINILGLLLLLLLLLHIITTKSQLAIVGHYKVYHDCFALVLCRYIQLPQPADYEQLAMNLQSPDDQTHVNCYKVILYIDGFIVRIQRPDRAGDAYFCGRHGKSCDSINVQLITDKSGTIRHIITGLAGSAHDKTAAAWSVPFRQFLDALPDNYVVLADAAYRGLHPRVITPVHHRQPLNVDQQAYNDACTRIRQIVERSIGATELKWRIQQLKENRIAAKKGVTFAAQCTIAAAVLHNRFTNFLQ